MMRNFTMGWVKRALFILPLLALGLAASQGVLPTYAQQSGHYLYFPLVGNIKIEYQIGADIYSTSYYMRTIDTATAYNMGCDLGKRDAGLAGYQDNIVILDYGRAIYDTINGTDQYGSRLFVTAARVDMDQIAKSAENFALGYYICTGSDTASHVQIGIGTNNYEYDGCTNCSHDYGHGQAWGQMVNGVNDWLVNKGYSGQVSAAGANDIELSWNSYARTKDWLDGYGSSSRYFLLNYGALPGCPYFNATGAQCGGAGFKWSKDEAWYVSYGAPPVYPVPEIYANNGVNAQQWFLMSVYSYTNHGIAMEFPAVMTQWQACQGSPGDPTCDILDNTPEEGLNQLQTLLNGDERTKNLIRLVTDIRW